MPTREYDFKASIKQTLAARVGYKCSNPHCNNRTSCGHSDNHKAVNLGDAAHIYALTGIRHDPQIDLEQIRNTENGIWLCAVCHKRIDRDQKRFTAKLLIGWKLQAEARAELETQGISIMEPKDIEVVPSILDRSIKMPSIFQKRGEKPKILYPQYYLKIEVENTGYSMINILHCAVQLKNSRGIVQEYFFENKIKEILNFKDKSTNGEGYIEHFCHHKEILIGFSFNLGILPIPKEFINTHENVSFTISFDDSRKSFIFSFADMPIKY